MKQKIPGFVRVFVRDSSWRYLCLKDLYQHWNLPGGKLEPGENAMDAAIRELKEETGLKLIHGMILGSRRLVFGGVEWEGYFACAIEVVNVPFLAEPLKFKALDYLGIEELLSQQSEGYAQAIRSMSRQCRG